MRDSTFNETDYLIEQVKVFLNQTNYDNDQLNNVTALMDSICRRSESEQNYPISLNIDVDKYSNPTTGKYNRCRAIDEAMNAMFGVFKRAAYNRSEPLDFTVIEFYPNATNKAANYNLTDLINTSWIKSDFMLEQVCKITDSVKEYVSQRTNDLDRMDKSQIKSQTQQSGMINSLIEFLDRLLNPILGLQRRLYWEGNNRFEIAYSTIGNGLSGLRNGLGRTYKNTRERISGVFSSSSVAANSSTTSTIATPVQPGSLNQTKLSQIN